VASPCSTAISSIASIVATLAASPCRPAHGNLNWALARAAHTLNSPAAFQTPLQGDLPFERRHGALLVKCGQNGHNGRMIANRQGQPCTRNPLRTRSTISGA